MVGQMKGVYFFTIGSGHFDKWWFVKMSSKLIQILPKIEKKTTCFNKLNKKNL